MNKIISEGTRGEGNRDALIEGGKGSRWWQLGCSVCAYDRGSHTWVPEWSPLRPFGGRAVQQKDQRQDRT